MLLKEFKDLIGDRFNNYFTVKATEDGVVSFFCSEDLIDLVPCEDVETIVIRDGKLKLNLWSYQLNTFELNALNTLAKTPYEEWFEQPKYNVVIGGDTDGGYVTAYFSDCVDFNNNLSFDTNDGADEYSLAKKDYQFSKEELEELYSQLKAIDPKFEQIAILGTREVK